MENNWALSTSWDGLDRKWGLKYQPLQLNSLYQYHNRLVWVGSLPRAVPCTAKYVRNKKKKKSTLKFKSLENCKKMEASSLLQRVCLSLIVSFTTTMLWTMQKHTQRHSFGKTSSRGKTKELITFQRTLAVARRAAKAPLVSITVCSNKQTAVAPSPPKYRPSKVHLLAVRPLALMWVFPHPCNKCWENLNAEDAVCGRRHGLCFHERVSFTVTDSRVLIRQ